MSMTMNIFDSLVDYGHEEVLFYSDPKTGLRAIIGVHNTVLGPALGGTRMWNYANDGDALTDVLRLSKGMTYKAAVAGLNLGGGKGVIIGDARTQKSEGLFRAYGKAVESLGGRYITAEDVNTNVRDMSFIRTETQFVTGVEGPGGSGDPSPFTAYGVYCGIKATAKKQLGKESVSGMTVAVQGAGNVASYVVEHLVKDGAKVLVTDIFKEKALALADRTGAMYVEPDSILSVECDILSPNALGAILNDDSIPQLKCALIAGGANNQLADEKKHGAMLKERGILYAPDYVINAGGLMNVASEVDGYNKESVLRKNEGIYDTLLRIYAMSEERNILTVEASNALAEERIASVAHVHRTYSGKTVINRSQSSPGS
jgi:leucine dehydrogenase